MRDCVDRAIDVKSRIFDQFVCMKAEGGKRREKKKEKKKREIFEKHDYAIR